MALVSDNVRVGVTGVVYVAPLGSTLPTSVSTTPAAAFVDVGYISDGGITQSISSDSTDIVAWQNATTVRTLQTSHTVTYQMEFLEVNWVTLDTYFGNFSAGVSHLTADQTLRKSWIIHVDDGTDDIRIVVPSGQITERGDTVFVSGEAIKLPITITAYPDNTGVKAYWYTSEAGS
jgi:hypothetical protein